ncbi:MAG: hypothetical protein IKQ56_00290, partial [Lachnospiraceae bacterium]|nr:hypothetical protein [Lachnospiraceae bacterium]
MFTRRGVLKRILCFVLTLAMVVGPMSNMALMYEVKAEPNYPVFDAGYFTSQSIYMDTDGVMSITWGYADYGELPDFDSTEYMAEIYVWYGDTATVPDNNFWIQSIDKTHFGTGNEGIFTASGGSFEGSLYWAHDTEHDTPPTLAAGTSLNYQLEIMNDSAVVMSSDVVTFTVSAAYAGESSDEAPEINDVSYDVSANTLTVDFTTSDTATSYFEVYMITATKPTYDPEDTTPWTISKPGVNGEWYVLAFDSMDYGQAGVTFNRSTGKGRLVTSLHLSSGISDYPEIGDVVYIVMQTAGTNSEQGAALSSNEYLKIPLPTPQNVSACLTTLQSGEMQYDASHDPENPDVKTLTGGNKVWAGVLLDGSPSSWDKDLVYHVVPLKGSDLLKIPTGTSGYLAYSEDAQTWQWSDYRGTIFSAVGLNGESVDSVGNIPVTAYQFSGTAPSDMAAMDGYYDGDDMIILVQTSLKSDPTVASNYVTISIPLNSDSLGKRFYPGEINDDPVTPVTVTQPGVSHSSMSVTTASLEDLKITKTDGSFTFDSLLCDDTVVEKGTDYTVEKNSITIKNAYLKTLGVGDHTLTFHYTGMVNETAPVDPSMTLTIKKICTATVKVTGSGGNDITSYCTIQWKNKANGKVIANNSAVSTGVDAGTTLIYTVKPTSSLENYRFYKQEVSGEVTLTETATDINVELPMELCQFTVVPKDGENQIPEEYTVYWYDSNMRQTGTGNISPLISAGATLRYEIKMSGSNADTYNDVKRTLTAESVPGNTNIDVAVTRKTSVVMTVKLGSETLDPKDYTVIWYTSKESTDATRSLVRYGTGRELKNIDINELYYEIIPVDHDGVYNWTRFYPVPVSLDDPNDQDKPGTKKTLTMGTVNNLEAVVTAVGTVTLTVDVTNGGGFNLDVTATQTPWDGYSVQPNTWYYTKSNGAFNYTLTKGNDGKYTATVYDFDANVRVYEKNDYGYAGGNYETAYSNVKRKSAQDGTNMATTVALIPAALPDSIGLNITRETPSFDTRWHWEDDREVYGADGYISQENAYYYEEANSFSFSLYNVTKNAVVPAEDYNVIYSGAGQRVEFNTDNIYADNSVEVGDTLRLTATVDQDKVKNVHANIPATMTSEITVKKYWSQEDYRNDSYRFKFKYSAWGRVSLETQADGSYWETYGIYGSDGGLVESGRKASWWRASSVELAPGTYTVCIWRETSWISAAPSTLEDLESLLNTDEYQKRTVTVDYGQTVKASPAFGICKSVPDRSLFTEDSGFAQELTTASGGETVQFRLNYEVTDTIRQANRNGLYAIRVSLHGKVPGFVLKTETDHTWYNTEKYDKNINLFVDGELDTENTSRLIFYSYNGQSHNPNGFVVYTDKPSGVIYFSVTGEMNDNSTYSFNADGWLCGSEGTYGYKETYGARARGAIGRTLYRVIPNANCAIYFASDYLRMADNGPETHNDYENGMWVYGSPNSRVALYMDGVKLEEQSTGSNGLAMFSVKMDDSFKNKYFKGKSGWTLSGKHEIYAITTLNDGRTVQSQTFERECLAKGSEINPAVLTKLNVISNAHAARDNNLLYYYGRTNNSYNGSYKNHIWTGYDVEQKPDLTYDFTATVENADYVDGDLVVWLSANGDETYRVPLKREGNTNTFKGQLDEGQVLWSTWEVTITSKKPARTGIAVEDGDINGKDRKDVSMEDVLKDALGDSGRILNPYTGEMQTLAQIDADIKNNLFGTNGLNLHTDAEYEAATDEDKCAMVKEDLEKITQMIESDAKAGMEMTENFFDSMEEIIGNPLPEDMVFDGSLASVQKLRSYMGINVYYPLAPQENDDADTKAVKTQLLKYLEMSDEEQEKIGTIETTIDGTKIRRFQRVMIETSKDDGKPHMYSLYISIYTDSPEGLIPNWAEVDVVDGGISEIDASDPIVGSGTDLFEYMANLTGDDFSDGVQTQGSGDRLPELKLLYRPGEEAGQWEAKIQSFTEIAVFGEASVSKVEQLNAAMWQNNKNMNNGNQTQTQNLYWNQMKYWKQENNIQSAGAGSAEGSTLTQLVTNINDMIEQGRKSGKLNEEQIKELTAMKQKVQTINDALSLNIAYEAGKSEVAIYEEIQASVDLVKNATKAGLESVEMINAGDSIAALNNVKDFAVDTVKDCAIDKAHETVYDSVNNADNAALGRMVRGNIYYTGARTLAELLDWTGGEDSWNLTSYFDEFEEGIGGGIKETTKLAVDPSRFIKEKADQWTAEKFRQYEEDINNIVDTLNNKYGMSKVRVKG